MNTSALATLRPRLAALHIVLFIALLSGCGGSPAGYQSADDLINAFNDMVGKEYVDVAAVFAMMHPENERQQQMLDSIRALAPYLQLDAAMRAEFNTPFEETSLESLYGQFARPARVTEQQEGRATAEFTDCNLRPQKLYLITHKGQWRLSGYTLEHHPQISADYDQGLFSLNLNNRQAFIPIAPDMVQRIRAAEFPYQLAARRTAHELAGLPFDSPAPGARRPASSR